MSKKKDEIPFAIEVGKAEEAPVVDANEVDAQDVVDADKVAAVEWSDVDNVNASDMLKEDEFSSEDEELDDGRAANDYVDKSTGTKLPLREILFGDFIFGPFLRRQVGFILFLVLLAIFYISNRYAAQQEIIEEEQLRKELVEKKNYAQTQYAELTMMSRQSGLEEQLRTFGDSLLQIPKEPPYVIGK